jgi:hypothetical protein
MSVVNNKLVCLHVRTMFMFVSFVLHTTRVSCMDHSNKSSRYYLLFSPKSSPYQICGGLKPMYWTSNTDTNISKQWKMGDIRWYGRVTMFCSIRDTRRIMFKVRWKVMAGRFAKREHLRCHLWQKHSGTVSMIYIQHKSDDK